jgi:uncharacterized protein
VPSQPPYFLLTQFPGETTQRFQLTAALTPRGRANLSALLTGVVDASDNLRLELLELPREGVTPGPGQAQQRMVNDVDARSRITLLAGQGGQAQVVYGNLLSLPYGGGMLYVEPVYLKSANVSNAFPLMRLVLVSYGSLVGFDTTLQGAINSLMQKAGENPGQPPAENPPPGQNPPPTIGMSPELAAAAAKIDAAIAKLHDAQAKSDFTAWGQALAELEQATKEFQAAQAKQNATPTPTPTATPSPTPTG